MAAQAAAAPWVDLPEGLTDLILERLPLADYVRFPAVCPKWRSIQRDHRLRGRDPLPVPWLCDYPPDHGSMISLNLFDAANNPPKCLRFPLTTATVYQFPLACSSGWLVLVQDEFDSDSEPQTQALFNPVSGTYLPLPPLPQGPFPYTACMSFPPTHPDCAVIIPYAGNVFLWRAGETGWAKLSCPNMLTASNWRIETSLFYDGKFYFLLPEGHLNLSLFVVDPFLTTPAADDDVLLLDMGWSHSPFTDMLWSSEWRKDRLVECDGDLLMVVLLVEEDIVRFLRIKRLLVFRADFSRKMWVRVESLGERALFISSTCSFSLVAANVGVVENYVYFSDSYENMGDAATLWTAFDLGAGRVVHGPPVPDRHAIPYRSTLLSGNNFWIIPRLASVTPTSD